MQILLYFLNHSFYNSFQTNYIIRLQKKYSDVCLYIGGSGEEENINKIIKDKELEKNVKLLGWINGKKKEDIIKKCAYFALPSYFEAMPMSVLEAMSYKCATISTNVGGIPQIIETGKNGYLLKPGDCENLYNTFCELFENSHLVKDISEAARIRIEEKFDLQKNLLKIKEIYLDD